MKTFYTILKKTLGSWLSNDPFTQSAATAYYAIFSLPGLLIIVMTIAGVFFEQARVEQEIMTQMNDLVGQKTAESVYAIMDKTRLTDAGWITMTLGLGTLLFGATGLFVQLQRSLNQIWEVTVRKRSGVIKFLWVRLMSLSMIIVIGFLLMVSLTMTTVLSILGGWLQGLVPDVLMKGMIFANMGLSACVTILLFTLIFKILPDAKILWRYAFAGGVLSAFLFKFGEYGLNSFFTIATPQSAFGAAGSLVVVMIWMFYSCLILLLGGEFAKTWGERQSGHKAEPTSMAKKSLRH